MTDLHTLGRQSAAARLIAVDRLDRVPAKRLGTEPWSQPRWPDPVATFKTATRLEAGSWEMGLAAR